MNIYNQSKLLLYTLDKAEKVQQGQTLSLTCPQNQWQGKKFRNFEAWGLYNKAVQSQLIWYRGKLECLLLPVISNLV